MEELACIVVYNKSDLSQAWSRDEKISYAGRHLHVEVSARTGENVGRLRSCIMERLFGDAVLERDGVMITNVRHTRCLEAVLESLTRGIAALDSGLSEEYVLLDLHASLSHFGELTGETGTDDLLDEIFSRFCVGK